jgi:hypothetical protein
MEDLSMLNRTTVLLPHALKSRAVKAAADKEMSFGELVRIALEVYLTKKQTVTGVKDTFFDDQLFYEGKVPVDIAKNHDDYLYGK